MILSPSDVLQSGVVIRPVSWPEFDGPDQVVAAMPERVGGAYVPGLGEIGYYRRRDGLVVSVHEATGFSYLVASVKEDVAALMKGNAERPVA